jgi:hypothetical protein
LQGLPPVRPMTGTVTLANGRYLIDAPWDPDLVTAVRRLPGRRVEARNQWSVPEAYGAALYRIALEHGLSMEYAESDAVRATVEHGKRGFMLRFAFADQELLKAAASIPGAQWFQPLACWLVPDSAGVAVHLWAEPSRTPPRTSSPTPSRPGSGTWPPPRKTPRTR